jgi:hypothetical protein
MEMAPASDGVPPVPDRAHLDAPGRRWYAAGTATGRAVR